MEVEVQPDVQHLARDETLPTEEETASELGNTQQEQPIATVIEDPESVDEVEQTTTPSGLADGE